jgi:dihydroorotase|tara:strand:- start:34122 stop:35381 length:1260 start_codon:yes stop_codon:yes gene_type:complete
MTLLIKNGKIYQNGNLVRKNIFIKSSKNSKNFLGRKKSQSDFFVNNEIIKITSQNLKSDKIIDAKNKIIIPGLIDSHVHFREPGLTHKEDFLTGSMAAAAGGITTILDMPNTIPPTTNLQRLDEKRRLAKKSIVNYGFHFGSTNDNIAEIQKVKDVASVKVYMDYTTGDLKVDNKHALKNLFSSNKTIAVHAENEHILQAIKLIQHSHNHLYFCHISSKQDLYNARRGKIKNEVFVEVTPHHLFMTEKNLNDLESFGEMKPHLKTEKDQKALWEGIHNGNINTIATDHAPHTKEEKFNPNYPYGVPGCETMLPLLLNAVNEKKLTLKKLVQLCCENSAKIFKIKNKGFIKEGFDADLTIIDLDLEKEVKNNNLFTKCKWSPFDSWKLKGWPVTTIVNGNIIFSNGKINKVKANEVLYHE